MKSEFRNQPKLPLEQELVREAVPQFNPGQFDEAMRDPSASPDLSGKRLAAAKLITKLVSDSDSLQQTLERTMNAFDAVNAVAPFRTQKSFVGHYQRAHGDLCTVRNAIQQMKRVSESGLKE